MRVLPILLLVILSLSCRDGTRLRQVPPEPPCEPTEEVCDGRDNDCDNLIDEALYQDCSSTCGPGRITCAKGVWSECSAPKPKTEVCNGIDDDCNSMVDEGLEVKPCYPRDNSELLNGVCRFGVERCVAGAYSCIGWIGPKAEDCNGLDDDCDGQTDEGKGSPLDIVVPVDYSGSMTSAISGLLGVTATWGSKYTGRSDLRFAHVGIPSDVMSADGKVTLMSNMSDAATFVASLNAHPSATGGGQEPSIDAVYQTSQPSNPLGINWTPGARRAIIMYTDEPPQSYLTPLVTEQQAKDEALHEGVKVFIFTSDPSWSTWSPRPFYQGAALEAELDKVIAEGSCK